MISHYTAIVFIIAFSMGIMILAVKGNHFMPLDCKRAFTLLFLLLILANLAEWLAASINGGNPQLRTLHLLSKFIELLITPIIPAVCALALDGDKHVKLMGIPIGINLLLQTVSLFSGAVFVVDVNNVYHRGPFYGIYIATILYGMLFLLIHCIQCSKRYQYQNILFLSLIMLLVVIALASQLVFSYLRLDWVCVSIAAIMFYIYYDGLVQQIDPLTTLLNRRSYERQVEQLKNPSGLLFLDVDNFKNVNDVYGHGFADDCLLRLAVEMKRVFGKYGYCYRYGGDEFCAVLTRNSRNLQRLISSYLHTIENLRAQDSRLPYVSIGYALYDPAEESIQEALARADAMMYKYKALHHSSKNNPLDS